MPPKKKKIDPEEQKAQFEAWKQTEEYKLMNEINTIYKEFHNITETTLDLTGDWYKLFDKVYDLFKMLKIKCGKTKGFPQPQMRSFFFSRPDEEDKKRFIDGIYCGVTKEADQNPWHLRHKFLGILNFCTGLEDLTYEDYQAKKKELIKTMNEYIKFFAQHLKMGHKEIYEVKLAGLLKPLKDLIDINYSYRGFNHNWIQEVEKEVRDFKLKAIIDKYVLAFQEILRILYYRSNGAPLILCAPDIRRFFYKISLKGWKDRPAEEMYLRPLHQNFKKMQKRLWKMWFEGINYWKIPLHANEELIQDIKDLINSELIAERLIGDPLKRDQLNFFYDVITLIKKANEKVFENMLKKDENTTLKSIPRLITFKMMLYMRQWKDKKQEYLERKAIEKERMEVLNDLRKQEEANSPLAKANRSFVQTVVQPPKPSPNKKSSKKETQPIKEEINEEEKKKQTDEELFGRYWILEKYIAPEKQEIFEQCSEFLLHVNQAVQQDIEDSIIKEGITPKTKKRQGGEDEKAQREAARVYLDSLMEKDNANEAINKERPPVLWNFQDAIQKHQFRSIANPKACYIDGRIETLEDHILDLADHLSLYQKDNFRELVSRVIDIFNGLYVSAPTGYSPADYHFSD